MLQKIREKATGIIGIIIIILISITFALWGVQNYFMSNVQTAVATVNEVEIETQDYEQRYARYRQQLASQGVDTTVLNEPVRRREFLDAMIDSEVWRQAAANAGIAITPEEIRDQIAQIEAFQINGEFSPEVYVELLTIQGLTPQMLEQDLRDSALVERLPEIVAGTSFSPQGEVDRLTTLVNQRRDFEYVVFEANRYIDGIEPSEDAIAAHYEENRESYREPEQVTIEYVEIDSAEYAGEIIADELILQDRYETEKGRFRTPERRLTSHILLELAEDATVDEVGAAESRAAALVADLRGGADFAEVARETSDDFASAEEGGDLGWVNLGDMVEAFETALFALEEGVVSDPVRTSFGVHIILARQIDEERGKTFEEAREELAREYQEAEAERQFIGLQDQLEELLNYSESPDMTLAAEEMGLSVAEVGPFPRSGGAGIASQAEVINAAFSETVLEEGLVSDPVTLGPNHVAFLRVIDHELSRIQELEEVRDAVTEDARLAAAAAAAETAAEALAAQIGDDTTLATLAEGDEALSLETVAASGRFGGGTPQALLQAIFEQPHPADGEIGIHVLPIDDERFAVVALSAVSVAEDATNAATAQFMGIRASRSHSAAELSAMGDELRDGAQIQVNDSLLSGPR